MALSLRVRERARRLADQLAGRPDYFLMNSLQERLYRDLLPHFPRLAGADRLLDAGAGRGAYTALLAPHGRRLVGLDRRPAPGMVAGDLEWLPFADAGFDAVFCSQVLEHTPHPARALAELARCTAPGGRILLSAPHVSHLHNEPHDYFRFTPHGLRLLLRENGWLVEEVWTSGGLMAMLAFAPSTLLGFGLGARAAARPARWLLRLLYALIGGADRLLGWRSLYPQNVLAVARRCDGKI